MSFDAAMREEARLRALQALAEQPDGTLSDAMVGCALRTFGISRGEGFVRAELAWLAEAGAVRTRSAGDLVLATLTRRGQEHVDRAAYLPGVTRHGVRSAVAARCEGAGAQSTTAALLEPV